MCSIVGFPRIDRFPSGCQLNANHTPTIHQLDATLSIQCQQVPSAITRYSPDMLTSWALANVEKTYDGQLLCGCGTRQNEQLISYIYIYYTYYVYYILYILLYVFLWSQQYCCFKLQNIFRQWNTHNVRYQRDIHRSRKQLWRIIHVEP